MLHSIRDIITNNESAIAVFTKGPYLTINSDGSGSTGIWVTDPEWGYDSVVIYHRLSFFTDNSIGEIYKGKFMGFRGSGVKSTRGIERQYILFTEFKNLGNTKANWIEFCEGGQNPVKLFSPEW